MFVNDIQHLFLLHRNRFAKHTFLSFIRYENNSRSIESLPLIKFGTEWYIMKFVSIFISNSF